MAAGRIGALAGRRLACLTAHLRLTGARSRAPGPGDVHRLIRQRLID